MTTKVDEGHIAPSLSQKPLAFMQTDNFYTSLALS